MKVLIVEDESRAANRLEKLLKALNLSIEIVAVIETVREAIVFLKTAELDLIFSDIQLADGLSFEIYKEVEVTCPIIFTTAYDQYAIEAFDTNGIDYLLKPIESGRLEKALAKCKQLNQSETKVDLQSLLNQFKPETKTYKSRFMIKVGEKIKTIKVEDTNAFYSEQKGTYLLTNEGRNYVLDHPLEQVASQLDPTIFFKISRKIVVNINAIEEIIAHSNSRLKLKIPHLSLDEVIVAREKVNDFKAWIGG
ncbi:MAG: LytR/AlgR family response regulator transcription factor [Crocinitomicaceae bacterium]